MEFTKQNFEQDFEYIKEAIKWADFISVDAEFTGKA
jgi:hypothetical protein